MPSIRVPIALLLVLRVGQVITFRLTIYYLTLRAVHAYLSS